MEVITKKQHGFTLAELVIVIIVLAIIGAVISTRWPSGANELNAATLQVASDIRYTQALSMSLNRRYEFHFGGNSYYIADETETGIAHPTTGSSNPINLGSGIIFTSSDCIAFDGRGSPQLCKSKTNPGDSIPSAIELKKTGAGTKMINIASQTGYINIS